MKLRKKRSNSKVKIGKKLNKKKQSEKNKKIDEKLKRVSSGIKKFDKMTSGGFEENSTNLVIGGDGSGKTIFAMSFLIEGIKRGENVLYINFEESKENFFRNMLGLGWDLSKFESSGRFTFLEYSPEKIKMMIDEGGGVVEEIILKNKIKRLVIDSLTSFLILFPSKQLKRQAISSLFNLIEKWDCTSILTLQEFSEEIKNKRDSEAESQADSIILLYLIKVKNERKRFIEVLKMRGTRHSTGTYEFKIKKGIEIGNKKIIK
ncbi:MAG: ATPase domain-containing protein [Candidatus Pacearchaeota archaeon]